MSFFTIDGDVGVFFIEGQALVKSVPEAVALFQHDAPGFDVGDSAFDFVVGKGKVHHRGFFL